MIRATIILLIAAAIAPAAAQTSQCGPRDRLAAHLAAKYSETPRAEGLTAQGTLAELWVSPGGSWTLMHSTPQGLACIVAFGEAWQAVVATPPGTPG